MHPDPGISASGVNQCDGLSALADRYEVFLIDQWGVLHDGHRLYPGVIECLGQLRLRDKPVAILSNSGRRAASNADRLKHFGIDDGLISTVVTSGEVAWQMLATGHPFLADLAGQRGFLMSSETPPVFTVGLAMTWVADPADADFVMLAGLDEDATDAVAWEVLNVGLARGLPLVCTNPDLQRITSAGLKPSSGSLAQDYQSAGGNVRFIGKPYPDIYRHVLDYWPDIEPARVLAIGDSIHHDVKGGKAAGVATALVSGGVHQGDLAGLDGDDAVAALERLAGDRCLLPDWLLPGLRW